MVVCVEGLGGGVCRGAGGGVGGGGKVQNSSL